MHAAGLLADDTGFVFARLANSSSITVVDVTLLIVLKKVQKPRDFDLNFVDTALTGTRSWFHEFPWYAAQ